MSHSPDRDMFYLFNVHSKILDTPHRDKYFMLSSGANQFVMPQLYKKTIVTDYINNDLYYQWYTGEEGFPTIVKMIDIFESIGCGGPSIKGFSSYESCITVGATQAISLVFRYLSKIRPHTKVLLLGYNYSIYDRCINTYKCRGFELIENHSEDSTLPTINHVLDYIKMNKPDLVVLTLPNNPSGELYAQSELREILTVCAKKEVYVLVDKVGLFDIPDEKWPNIAQIIDESNAHEYTIIVNSFSKTCSIPNCRIGYIYGPREIVSFVRRAQFEEMMCPPFLLVTGITLDICFRIVYLSRRGHFPLNGEYKNPWSFFSELYDRTSVILDKQTRGIIFGLFEKEHLEMEYKKHVEEMTANIKTVRSNMMYVINRLGERLIRSTKRDAGFNWFIQINDFKGLDPMKTSVNIFQDTGIAILPEPCFKLDNHLEYDDNFWFRVSLAVPQDAFENNFERFINYLNKTERR